MRLWRDASGLTVTVGSADAAPASGPKPKVVGAECITLDAAVLVDEGTLVLEAQVITEPTFFFGYGDEAITSPSPIGDWCHPLIHTCMNGSTQGSAARASRGPVWPAQVRPGRGAAREQGTAG